MNIKRSEYLAGKYTHREYYAQFVNSEVRKEVMSHIGTDLLVKSSDKHMNDIPLYHWVTITLPPLAVKMQDVGDYLTQAGKVCIAKEAAKQIKEML